MFLFLMNSWTGNLQLQKSAAGNGVTFKITVRICLLTWRLCKMHIGGSCISSSIVRLLLTTFRVVGVSQHFITSRRPVLRDFPRNLQSAILPASNKWLLSLLVSNMGTSPEARAHITCWRAKEKEANCRGQLTTVDSDGQTQERNYVGNRKWMKRQRKRRLRMPSRMISSIRWAAVVGGGSAEVEWSRLLCDWDRSDALGTRRTTIGGIKRFCWLMSQPSGELRSLQDPSRRRLVCVGARSLQVQHIKTTFSLLCAARFHSHAFLTSGCISRCVLACSPNSNAEKIKRSWAGKGRNKEGCVQRLMQSYGREWRKNARSAGHLSRGAYSNPPLNRLFRVWNSYGAACFWSVMRLTTYAGRPIALKSFVLDGPKRVKQHYQAAAMTSINGLLPRRTSKCVAHADSWTIGPHYDAGLKPASQRGPIPPNRVSGLVFVSHLQVKHEPRWRQCAEYWEQYSLRAAWFFPSRGHCTPRYCAG